MTESKVYAVYVAMPTGECLFAIDFAPMPESALITAMLSAIQSFILEISGTPAKKFSTRGFVFHIENLKKIYIAVATDSEKPPIELRELRTVFLRKFATQIENFRGDTSEFAHFEDDVKKIFNFAELTKRTPPKKKLTAYSLLQIPPDLQAVARELALNKETKIYPLSRKLKQSGLLTKMQLEELFDLGLVGKTIENRDFVYFL